MSDDKSKDKGGGMKDNVRDELDEATGKGKKKDSGGGSGGVKENVRDELDKATGKDKKKDSDS